VLASRGEDERRFCLPRKLQMLRHGKPVISGRREFEKAPQRGNGGGAPPRLQERIVPLASESCGKTAGPGGGGGEKNTSRVQTGAGGTHRDGRFLRRPAEKV